jgi:hypothetical protein
VEEADHRHPQLLRPRGERACRCSTEKAHQFAPSRLPLLHQEGSPAIKQNLARHGIHRPGKSSLPEQSGRERTHRAFTNIIASIVLRIWW